MKRLPLLLLLCAWLPAAGQSFEPFTFVQMSDTQIGFMDRSPGYGQSDSLMMAAVAAVNAVDPAFILLTGDLVNDPYDAVQDSIYRVRLAELKAPVHIIPGNHDMKGFSEAEHAHYMSMRSSDRFSFRSHDCAFIGFDSNCILDKATEFEAAQKAWLEAELAAARGASTMASASSPPGPWATPWGTASPDTKWSASRPTASPRSTCPRPASRSAARPSGAASPGAGLAGVLEERIEIQRYTMLKIGDKMPSFEVVDQDGNAVKSEDFIGKGRKTIIYFYPKDNTSGCTAEACSFRDNYAELTAAGYNVVGVSKDSQKSHAGFRAKYELPFRLLADTSLQMLQDFGAWGEKKMYGKSTMGTLRRTFIFDEDGILERIIEKVDTKNAATQILG